VRRPAAGVGTLLPALALSALLSGACSTDQEFEPPDREARVRAADAEFTTATFDTIAWASEDERTYQGNLVYSTSCRNCHGSVGEAGTAYARERGLEVPSLVESDWRYADSRDSVLHRIYVGHASGMPTWGVGGISPREMDAVTYYVLEVLRPEMLGEDEAGTGPPDGGAGGDADEVASGEGDPSPSDS